MYKTKRMYKKKNGIIKEIYFELKYKLHNYNESGDLHNLGSMMEETFAPSVEDVNRIIGGYYDNDFNIRFNPNIKSRLYTMKAKYRLNDNQEDISVFNTLVNKIIKFNKKHSINKENKVIVYYNIQVKTLIIKDNGDEEIKNKIIIHSL